MLCVYCRRRLQTLCLRSDPSNLELVVLFHQRRISPDSSSGPVLFKFRGREGFWSSVWRFLQLSISSPRHLTRTLVNYIILFSSWLITLECCCLMVGSSSIFRWVSVNHLLFLQHQTFSSCCSNTDLRTRLRRRKGFWKPLKQKLRARSQSSRSLLLWNTVLTTSLTWLSR